LWPSHVCNRHGFTPNNAACVRYTYKDSRGRTSCGHVALYAMAMYRQGLYVVGPRLADPEGWRKRFGIFAVERFADAEHLRERSFDVPADFQLDEFFSPRAFGMHLLSAGEPKRVVIEFSMARASFVRARVFHPMQQGEDLPDGACGSASRA
jgi:hypothetical protein